MGSFEKTNKPYFTTVKLITTLFFFYNCQSYAVCSLVKQSVKQKVFVPMTLCELHVLAQIS